MSGRKMNAEQRQEQIVRMATRLFADNGFDGTRFWQIAAACGVSEGNILHFFPNKEALYNACFRQAIRNTLPTMSEISDRTDKALYDYALRFPFLRFKTFLAFRVSRLIIFLNVRRCLLQQLYTSSGVRLSRDS